MAHILYFSYNPTFKCVSLTFDDGPDVYYTSQILDIFKQNNVKATFFIVGLRAQAQHPGGIILLHCAGGKDGNLSNTVKALPKIISSLKSQGYSFYMVQDLLNIPASK